MAQKWTVEFTVADTWVADGFELTEERARNMLENDLQFAYSHELGARIIQAPPTETIKGLQSGEIEAAENENLDDVGADDPTVLAPELGVAEVPEIGRYFTAAIHALRSYQFGNASPDLAEIVANELEAAFQKMKGEVV